MVGDFNSTFAGATAFNDDLSDWNVSSAEVMIGMFDSANTLSNPNKRSIHASFSSNSNWIPTIGLPSWLLSAPVDLNSTAELTVAENQPVGTDSVGEFNAS